MVETIIGCVIVWGLCGLLFIKVGDELRDACCPRPPSIADEIKSVLGI